MPAMASTITTTRREPTLVRTSDAIDLSGADAEQDVFVPVDDLAFAGDQLHVIGAAGAESFCDDFPSMAAATGALDFELKSGLGPALLLSLCLHGLVAGAFLMSARHEPAF